MKILGAIELWRTRFDYCQATVFNATTYLGFLEQLARQYRRQGAILIQDNASYHKDAEVWAWFKCNRHWLEVHQLPPYSPELNPTERLWQHTRKNGTHNRFFGHVDALLATLVRVFGEMQSHPELIRSWLLFVDQYVPLLMRACIEGRAHQQIQIADVTKELREKSDDELRFHLANDRWPEGDELLELASQQNEKPEE